MTANRRFFLLGLAGFAAIATTPAVAANTAEAQVKAALDDFFAKAAKREWDATGAMMAPHFSIWIDGDDQYDKEKYLAALKADDMKVLDMSLADLEVVASPDGKFAWCCYRATVKAVWGEKTVTTRTAETILYEHANGQWLMRHCHVSIARNA